MQLVLIGGNKSEEEKEQIQKDFENFKQKMKKITDIAMIKQTEPLVLMELKNKQMGLDIIEKAMN